MSDPLPQAMVLTAIVITLGMTAFLLALAYRSWHLNGHDEVQDDVEDRRIMELADRDEGPGTADNDAGDGDGDGDVALATVPADDTTAPPAGDAGRGR
jgi:multicomponent Na+:H+ antiporter subunit C